MNEDPDSNGNVAAPVFVEDVFLTDVFLIKGRLAQKFKRLANVLEDFERQYLTVQDATLVSLRNNEVIKAPTVKINIDELILAHELVDMAGDEGMRRLRAGKSRRNRIRAFYNGSLQFEIGGLVEPGAYESHPVGNRKYFNMLDPVVRGLDLDHPDLKILQGLDYAIMRKDRMAYVYDFS